MGIQEFSKLKANLSSMNKFFAENNIKLSDSEKAQIKSIFDQANTQKETDKNIEEQLTGDERRSFLNAIQDAFPNLYNKIENFFKAIKKQEYERDLTNFEIVKNIPSETRKTILENIKLNYPDIYDNISKVFSAVEKNENKENLTNKIDDEISNIIEQSYEKD